MKPTSIKCIAKAININEDDLKILFQQLLEELKYNIEETVISDSTHRFPISYKTYKLVKKE